MGMGTKRVRRRISTRVEVQRIGFESGELRRIASALTYNIQLATNSLANLSEKQRPANLLKSIIDGSAQGLFACVTGQIRREGK